MISASAPDSVYDYVYTHHTACQTIIYTQRQAQTAGTAKHSPSVLGRGGVFVWGCVELLMLSGHKSVYPPLARVHNINQNRMKDWVYGLVKLRFSFKLELE